MKIFRFDDWCLNPGSETCSPVRTDIRWATILPPNTAKPVQSEWPNMPPIITPHTS